MTECKNCIKQDVCDRDVGHGYSVCPHYLSANVVKVVRCRDCKYFYQDGNIKVCKHWNYHSTTYDAYCSYAKMKGDEEKGSILRWKKNSK